MTEIAVLSVTRLSGGVCVAGVTNDGEWIRPTRPNVADTWRQLEYSDCRDSSRQWVVRKGAWVRLDLVKSIPKGNHSEDWSIGNTKPVGLGDMSPDDYREVCASVTEPSLSAIAGKTPDRSLVMVHPDSVSCFDFDVESSWEGKKRYQPRCSFAVGGKQHREIAVSDAEWRKYGRDVMDEHGKPCNRKGSTVFDELDTEDCWLTIGCNQVSSNSYFLVVGIHLFPPVKFEMDFAR